MEDNDLHSVYRYLLARRSVGTGTTEQKQHLRAYLLTRSPSQVAQLSHIWNRVGLEICSKLIARVPWILEVFLACGYGRAYMSPLFMKVLDTGNVHSFLNTIQYEPFAERFAARSVENTYYKYVWNHYIPFMKGEILDSYLRFDGLVIDADVLLSIIPSLSHAQLEFILNHPRHRYLVYELSSPYAYVEAQVRRVYKYQDCQDCMNEPTARLQYCVSQYETAECLWKQLKIKRRVNNWRFLFWCTVLHSRMMEFREKYWALSSKHVQNAANEFYSLVEKIEGLEVEGTVN
jgi:hypothetical protein